MVLSKTSTFNLSTLLSSVPISLKLGWNDHSSIAVIGVDNMGYYTHNAQVHVNESSQIITYTWIDTINYWQQYNHPTSFGEFLDTDHLFRRIRDLNLVKQQLDLTESMMNNALNDAYFHACTQVNNNSTLLHRPPLTGKVPICGIEFQSPVFHLKTSKYVDMEKYLNHVYLKYIGI